MMRAMFAAIAGLRNHITFMDVVGNNIANVNTTAFKSSRVTFQDMMSQTQTGASAPTSTRGGTNPIQVGLGMTLGAVDVMQSQGSLQSTGKQTDFAVQGNGFFILRDGNRSFYTRDGAFDVAVSGELVNPVNGFKVMGWSATPSGDVDLTKPVDIISIPFGQAIAAQTSSDVTFAGNFESQSPVGGTFATTIDVFDSKGAAHPVTVTFTKNAAANTWDTSVSSVDPNVTGVSCAPPQMVFNNSGGLITPAPPAPLVLTTNLSATAGAVSPMVTNIKVANVTQFAAAGQVAATFNNGYAAGALVSFSVGPGGDITGIFSNGTHRPLGQMAMALFTNTSGLARAGANNFEPTSNSGIPIVGTPGSGGRGSVGTGLLEGSNTDLAREFTNIVMAQRGFQASSKVISTADQILEELVNLKR